MLRANSVFIAGLVALLLTAPAKSAEPEIPNFWDTKERLAPTLPDRLLQLRFLTTIDFPPFNYIDNGGRLTGFHVDLSREICNVLDLLDKCTIQAVPWEELEAALLNGRGDAVLAGITASSKKRKNFSFGRPYLRLPARFVIPVGQALPSPIHDNIKNRKIGVVAGSAHEAMLRDYFPDARAVTYSREEWMYSDLKAGKLNRIFGDGMKLSFWIASPGSGGCCQFDGGPYVSDQYLGHGLSIMTTRENSHLNDIFNFALRELQSKGVFPELYLRYFPVSFY